MQAARGASLSSSDPKVSATAPAPPQRRTLLFTLVSLAALAVDQVTKHLAVAGLTGKPPVHVVGDLLQLTLARNPGAAFSTGTRFTLVFSLVAIVATVVVGFLGSRARSPLWACGLGLLMAGVTGNLADRVFRPPGPLRGHVVDFLMLPNWPVFNVADVCINLAAVVIVVQTLRGSRIDGSRTRAQADGTPEHRP
jgi:signal peptidase II